MQPAPTGWYHAEGDVEGTVRYWDGTQWVGGPVAAPSPGPAAPQMSGEVPAYASSAPAPPLQPPRSDAFLTRLFSSQGRVNRQTYATVCIGWYIASIVVAVLVYGLTSTVGVPELGILFLYAVILGWVWPHVVTTAKRLHDQGHSGWLCLLALVPIASLVLIIMCLFIGGRDYDNEYGEPPNPGFAL